MLPAITRLTIILLLFAPFHGTLAREAGAQNIGIFYYPGWRDNVVSNVSPTPWEAIKPYPERKPMLGYYDDGNVAVMNQQLKWMADSGVDFIIMDWYWNHRLGVLKSHALAAYFKAPQRNRIKLTIMWANHTEFPESKKEFERMVEFWLYYFGTPEYLTVDGKPLVFIFSTKQLELRARAFGSTSGELLSLAQDIARRSGWPGIAFAGGAGANDPTVIQHSKGESTGYSAFFAYNYHGAGTYRYSGGRSQSHSFLELDAGYRDHWNWMLSNANVPYFVPMTAGWDRRPWGGSNDALHDNSVATPTEFEEHLKAGLMTLKKYDKLTSGIGVLCCWNEFGEGAFIEPTHTLGLELLNKIKNVFGQDSARNTMTGQK